MTGKRFLVRVAGLVLVPLVLTGCSARTSSDAPSTAPSNGDGGTSVTRPEHETGGLAPELEVTSCASLLREKWAAPAGGVPDINWDPETGVAVFSYTDVRLKVNVVEDATCTEVPDLAFFIESILDEHEANKAPE